MVETEQQIHERMMYNVDDAYDKSPGSFIWEANMAAAIEFSTAQEEIEYVESLMDVENLVGDELARFVNQRTGQERRMATHAIGTVEVEGNGLVRPNDLFQTSIGVQFEVTAEKLIQGIGQVPVRSVLPGSIGNVPAGQIIEIPVSLAGINNVTNSVPTGDGYEEESDDELRQRYYDRIQTPATSGNKWHYRNWAKEVSGVGAVRIVPLWAGPNTVKVIVIDSTMQSVSELLVKAIQDHIDPGKTGLGDGAAPIGAFCTVVSAIERPILVSFNVVMVQGYDDQLIIDAVSGKITAYLKHIAFQQNFISYAQIGGLILESDGVIDYSNLIVNDGIDNIILTDEEVATLGGVTIYDSP